MTKDTLHDFENIGRLNNTDQNLNNDGNNVVFNDIVKAVDSISDRINLLALNTAIENARTDTKGNGIAVISTQMSKLAEHISGFAKGIADIVKDVQADIESADGLIDDSKKYLNLQKILTKNIVTSLNEMFESIEKSRETINQLAAKPEEMSAVIGDNPDANDKRSPGISISVSQKTTQELNHHIDELRSLVNSFKL